MSKFLIVIASLFWVATSFAANTLETLSSCLRSGLENSYSLQIVRNEEQAHHNNATRANAGQLPTVYIDGDYSSDFDKTKYSSNGTTTRTTPTEHDWSLGLSAAWTVFDGFRIEAAYDRLMELKRQSIITTRVELENYIAGLAAEYYNYIHQRSRLRNYQYAVNLSRERLRIVEARYHVGNFSRLDYQQAKVDFNVDSANLIKQHEVVSSSQITLNEMMSNEDFDTFIEPYDTIIKLNTSLRYDHILDNAMESNAQLKQAAQSVAISEIDLREVLSRNYPYVGFSTWYGYSKDYTRSTVNSRTGTLGLNVALSVDFYLFDGTRRSKRQNAELDIANAKLKEKDIDIKIRSDLSNIWQAYINNQSLLSLEQSSLIAAKDNYEIAMERYMLGDLSGIEMREAQQSLLDAEERILEATFNIKLCEISLLQISGAITSYLE